MPLFGPPNVKKLKAKSDSKGLLKAVCFGKKGHDAHTVRQDAIEALVQIDKSQAIQLLIAELKNTRNNIFIRSDIAEALGKIGNPQAVEPLIAAFSEGPEGTVGRSARKALLEIDDPRAVEPLIAALKKNKPSVRYVAAQALGNIGDSRAVEPLISTLGYENLNVCKAAAEALGQIGDSCAVEPLINILRVEDYLGGVDEEIAKVTDVAIAALIKLGTPAVGPLIDTLGDKNEFARECAFKVLGQIGDPQAIGPLISALEHKSASTRIAAAEALGQIGDSCAVEPLITKLVDENSGVCEAAARALGQIGDQLAVEPLIAVLGYGHLNAREAAAEALGQIGDPRAIEPLVIVLEAENQEALTAAFGEGLKSIAEITARFAGTDVLLKENPPIIPVSMQSAGFQLDLTMSAFYNLRVAAAQALEQLGDPRAKELLAAALQSRDQHRLEFGRRYQ